MPRTKRALEQEGGPSKFQRYRKSQESKGMKLLRIWVPDPRRPEFAKEAARQGKLLRARQEERESMEFIATVVEWPEL